jgi:hypothetical protein
MMEEESLMQKLRNTWFLKTIMQLSEKNCGYFRDVAACKYPAEDSGIREKLT